MRSRLLASTLAIAALVPLGCGTKDDVSLAVYAQNLTLTKGKNAFGDKLDGSVDVVFDLGKWSGAPVKVESMSLALYRNGNTPVLTRAQFAIEGGLVISTGNPLTVSAGEKKTVRFTIKIESMTGTEPAEACAGPISASGNVKQLDKTAIDRIGATPVSVAGCP